MITCKEDLKGFYVLRSDKEVFELFMDKCEEFGVVWGDGSEPRSIKEGEVVAFSYTGDRLGFSSELLCKNLCRKAITLADFKEVSKKLDNYKGVASKWKYKKVDMTPTDIYRAMLDGEAFYVNEQEMYWNGNAFWLNCERVRFIDPNHDVCRKVKVKWQEEVEEYLLTCNAGCGMFDIQYGNGNQLALADEDFLEAARIALKVLGELE